MKKIVYIGTKDVKIDNVAGTGLAWAPRQVHEVQDDAKAEKLLAYPDIWRDATKWKPPVVEQPAVAKPQVEVRAAGRVHRLDVSEDVFRRVVAGQLVVLFAEPARADAFEEFMRAGQKSAPPPVGEKGEKKPEPVKA